MSITVYGIKQCDSVKKAQKWFAQHGVEYQFHDFRSDGLSSEWLVQVEAKVGWETLLNKRSTTFRELDDANKSALTQAKALQLMSQHPTLIKRPVVVHGELEKVVVGFKADHYEQEFKP
ncbi:ArsC family reductase [Alteromonas oceanisediminis]|uniref:ArsC family reductase n=1 Tax=Alteromonas oceanisediminis TaxID=2836180 RepID=UPI001BD9526B|nr:ArsC family reductase [Alteromonas oceanisediminis]MBT0587296.1 ArsC family reductase [Alteromonas oceanisediminis]